MLFSIYMAMPIKKVASYLAIQSTTLDFKHKVFYLQNICHPFANTLNLSHVILVKNKCHQKIKDKICPKKDVQEL